MAIPPQTLAPAHAEFSRPLAVEGIMPGKARTENIEASIAECAALARRFDLKSLSGLKSRMTVLRTADGEVIRVEGSIAAEVVQTCVVSLQDVPAVIETGFDVSFSKEGKELDEEDFGIELDEELPDVMHDGVLDLGELVAQYFSLELDPYPRAPGVSLAAQLAESGEEVKNRPFQVLLGLKPKEKE
jgi:uncharacterized metal-binding protein YceD (DUF177 family)